MHAFPTGKAKPAELAQQLKEAIAGAQGIHVNEICFVATDARLKDASVAAQLAAASIRRRSRIVQENAERSAEIAGTDRGGGRIEVGRGGNRNGKRDWERARRREGKRRCWQVELAGSGAGRRDRSGTVREWKRNRALAMGSGTGSGGGSGRGHGAVRGNGIAGRGRGLEQAQGRVGRFRNGKSGREEERDLEEGRAAEGERGTGHGLGEPTDEEDLRDPACTDNVWKSGERSEPAAAAVEFQGAGGEIAGRAQDVLREALAGIAEQGKNKKLDQSMLVQLAEHLSIRFALERFERGEVKVNAVRQMLDRMNQEIEALRKILGQHEDKMTEAGLLVESHRELLDRQFWASVPESAKREVLLSSEAWCIPPKNVQSYVAD